MPPALTIRPDDPPTLKVETLERDVMRINDWLKRQWAFNRALYRWARGSQGDLDVTGTLEHTGTKVGLYSATPVVQADHIADASTSHAITDPADSPADADALREDLVANTIPSIETALNALGTTMNLILVVLENLGPTKTA